MYLSKKPVLPQGFLSGTKSKAFWLTFKQCINATFFWSFNFFFLRMIFIFSKCLVIWSYLGNPLLAPPCPSRAPCLWGWGSWRWPMTSPAWGCSWGRRDGRCPGPSPGPWGRPRWGNASGPPQVSSPRRSAGWRSKQPFGDESRQTSSSECCNQWQKKP